MEEYLRRLEMTSLYYYFRASSQFRLTGISKWAPVSISLHTFGCSFFQVKNFSAHELVEACLAAFSSRLQRTLEKGRP